MKNEYPKPEEHASLLAVFETEGRRHELWRGHTVHHNAGHYEVYVFSVDSPDGSFAAFSVFFTLNRPLPEKNYPGDTAYWVLSELNGGNILRVTVPNSLSGGHLASVTAVVEWFIREHNLGFQKYGFRLAIRRV